MTKTVRYLDSNNEFQNLNIEDSAGMFVRFQNEFKKSLFDQETLNDPMVGLKLAYVMAKPRPTEDFETFCDRFSMSAVLPISNACVQLLEGAFNEDGEKAKNVTSPVARK